MLGYLSTDIICFEKRTVFRERSSRKTVSYEEQIMSKDKYPSIFSPQMATIVFIILQIFFTTRAILKIGEYSRIFPSFSWKIFGHVMRLDQSRASKKIWWIIRAIIPCSANMVSKRVILGAFLIKQLFHSRLLDQETGYSQRGPTRARRIIVKYSPIFKNCVRCEKDLKDSKDNSVHLGRKYAQIFVLGHHLFLVAYSFPRASLSGNCSLLGTDNVRGQISEHIFAPNGDYCLYIPQFSKLRVLQKRLQHMSSFSAKICLDICPRTLSVPRSKQFSSRYALRKLFTFRNRWCPWTNVLASSIFAPNGNCLI